MGKWKDLDFVAPCGRKGSLKNPAFVSEIKGCRLHAKDIILIFSNTLLNGDKLDVSHLNKKRGPFSTKEETIRANYGRLENTIRNNVLNLNYGSKTARLQTYRDYIVNWMVDDPMKYIPAVIKEMIPINRIREIRAMPNPLLAARQFYTKELLWDDIQRDKNLRRRNRNEKYFYVPSVINKFATTIARIYREVLNRRLARRVRAEQQPQDREEEQEQNVPPLVRHEEEGEIIPLEDNEDGRSPFAATAEDDDDYGSSFYDYYDFSGGSDDHQGDVGNNPQDDPPLQDEEEEEDRRYDNDLIDFSNSNNENNDDTVNNNNNNNNVILVQQQQQHHRQQHADDEEAKEEEDGIDSSAPGVGDINDVIAVVDNNDGPEEGEITLPQDNKEQEHRQDNDDGDDNFYFDNNNNDNDSDDDDGQDDDDVEDNDNEDVGRGNFDGDDDTVVVLDQEEVQHERNNNNNNNNINNGILVQQHQHAIDEETKEEEAEEKGEGETLDDHENQKDVLDSSAPGDGDNDDNDDVTAVVDVVAQQQNNNNNNDDNNNDNDQQHLQQQRDRPRATTYLFIAFGVALTVFLFLSGNFSDTSGQGTPAMTNATLKMNDNTTFRPPFPQSLIEASPPPSFPPSFPPSQPRPPPTQSLIETSPPPSFPQSPTPRHPSPPSQIETQPPLSFPPSTPRHLSLALPSETPPPLSFLPSTPRHLSLTLPSETPPPLSFLPSTPRHLSLTLPSETLPPLSLLPSPSRPPSLTSPIETPPPLSFPPSSPLKIQDDTRNDITSFIIITVCVVGFLWIINRFYIMATTGVKKRIYEDDEWAPKHKVRVKIFRDNVPRHNCRDEQTSLCGKAKQMWLEHHKESQKSRLVVHRGGGCIFETAIAHDMLLEKGEGCVYITADYIDGHVAGPVCIITSAVSEGEPLYRKLKLYQRKTASIATASNESADTSTPSVDGDSSERKLAATRTASTCSLEATTASNESADTPTGYVDGDSSERKLAASGTAAGNENNNSNNNNKDQGNGYVDSLLEAEESATRSGTGIATAYNESVHTSTRSVDSNSSERKLAATDTTSTRSLEAEESDQEEAPKRKRKKIRFKKFG